MSENTAREKIKKILQDPLLKEGKKKVFIKLVCPDATIISVSAFVNNYELFNNASKSFIVDNYSYIEDIVPSTLENTLCDYFIASHLIILTSITDTLMYLF